ncbi:MAG: DUF2851 family protein [Bacteroidetes bacterium]|nr:DUF2851 family protein [Bacteroidota bacterium]
MQTTPKIYERKLHEIWLSQDFSNPLETLSGEEIVILDTGILNEDTAGPDFKNARIRIGNLVYIGDIEIDSDYNNWKSHGHNIDNKHNKVILHASLTNKNNQHYVYTKDGRRVPTICLSRFIDKTDLHEFETSFKGEDENSQLKCSHLSDTVDFHLKKRFISELGMQRYQKKCEKVYNRLKELAYIKELHLKEPVIGYDLKPEFENKKFEPEAFHDKEIWQQLFYELVFEALGYSKNKNIMLRLAQSVNITFLSKLGTINESLSFYESALFNISGILPEKSKFDNIQIPEYINKLYTDWEIIKRVYDGQTFYNADWHFFKLRPQNFPTIRIAGGVKFLESLLFEDLLNIISKKFSEIRNLNVLINSIRSLFVIKGKGFWKTHYVFEQTSKDEIKYFVGAARADEIVVNVVLPFFSVYFDLFNEPELRKKILKIYNIYDQRSENKIVKEVADGLNTTNFLKKTVLTQGMLELFRNYCSKKKCLECEIGKIIFN